MNVSYLKAWSNVIITFFNYKTSFIKSNTQISNSSLSSCVFQVKFMDFWDLPAVERRRYSKSFAVYSSPSMVTYDCSAFDPDRQVPEYLDPESGELK